jgi:hypothetical protein
MTVIPDGRTRIRRSDDGAWLTAEPDSSRRLPEGKSIALAIEGQDISLVCHRTRKWRRTADECVSERQLLCWVMCRGERIGALDFREWHIDSLADESTFLEHMDRHTSANAAVSEVLCACWDFSELLDRGAVVEFRRSWMSFENSTGKIWPIAANTVIDHFYSKSAIIILKAFPLEYEGHVDQDQGARRWFDRRRSAMIRYYQRALRVGPLPGTLGIGGWMWRRMNKRLPEPGNSNSTF